MFLNKFVLALLLVTPVINSTVREGLVDKYSEPLSKDFHSHIVIGSYPSSIFLNDNSIMCFFFSVLLYTRQEMGFCNNHFSCNNLLELGELVKNDSELYHFMYWDDSILMSLRRDKINETITLDLITDEKIDAHDIGKRCATFIWGHCVEVTSNW
jgi:hypothetical protein